MTVKREFSCDLCRDSIADYKGGIGIKWTALNELRSTMISDSERHLCNRCCQCLKDMFGDLDAISAERTASPVICVIAYSDHRNDDSRRRLT